MQDLPLICHQQTATLANERAFTAGQRALSWPDYPVSQGPERSLRQLGIQDSDRVAEILDSACRVIARDGWHGLRMDAVAREAGVSKALVHYSS